MLRAYKSPIVPKQQHFTLTPFHMMVGGVSFKQQKTIFSTTNSPNALYVCISEQQYTSKYIITLHCIHIVIHITTSACLIRSRLGITQYSIVFRI
jgi:hypothetical protein